MKFRVTVKPRAKTAKVEEVGANALQVSVKEPAAEGKANKAVIAALARHFKTSPSRVRIVTGRRIRNKIIEIL